MELIVIWVNQAAKEKNIGTKREEDLEWSLENAYIWVQEENRSLSVLE